MFMDLWVATDGITTVRFSDQQSAEIYCAETGWNKSDLLKVRQQVTVSEDGSVIVEPWCNRMDPQVDTEVQGTWSDDTYLPPQNSMAQGTSEDDLPVTYNSEYLYKLGVASERTGWPFRDLALHLPEFQSQVFAYVAKCDAEHRKPNLQELEKLVGAYAN